EDDRDVPRRDGDAQDDAEDVHEAVLAPEDEVGQEAGLGVLLCERVLLDFPPECEPGRHAWTHPKGLVDFTVALDVRIRRPGPTHQRKGRRFFRPTRDARAQWRSRASRRS